MLEDALSTDMMTITTSKLSQLWKHRAKLQQLEQELGSHERKLLELPAKTGYKSIDELIDALTLVKNAHPSLPRVHPRTRLRKRRVIITSGLEAEVKKLVHAGKTGRDISEQLDIAPATVQNIKSRLGLTKKRD
jgi:DNA-binding CsgD family transcriptional regulator